MLICLGLKINQEILSRFEIYQENNSNTTWNYCSYLMIIIHRVINHIMFTSKTLMDLCMIKKDKNKKYFHVNCLQCFSSKSILMNHRKIYLEISGKQSASILKKDINV